MNTLVKIHTGTSEMNLLVENCYIHTIGQFIIWTQGSAIKQTILINNYVDGSTCGGVTNANAALFRIRSGKLEAYANYFKGNSANVPGYFECSSLASVVKFNAFENVSSYAFSSAANKLVFDQNLYITGSKVLDKAHASVSVNGVTADKTVAKSVEETKALYLEHLLSLQPTRYFKVEFDVADGNIISAYPSIYDLTVGISELPIAEREGYIFAGWLLDGELVESVPVGTEGDITLVAKWNEISLVVDGTTEEGHYATIADALAAAKDGDIISIVAGEYDENITISIPNLIIKGPNAGISAHSSNRGEEAVIKGVITLTSAAGNVTFDGLSFTGTAKIKYDESKAFEGFTFKNNKVYDTTEASAAFSIDRYVSPAFIQFTLKDGGSVKNVVISNNSFVNVSETNLLFNRAINVSVDNNVFKNFDLDAIRIEGGHCYGTLAFTNNMFEQTVKEHGSNAIFLFSVAGPDDNSKAIVLIENNEFINIGSNNGSNFTGAISGYRFQEHYTSFEIKNNIFDHCYDYLYIRNNGGNDSNWFCKVEDNQFLGLPHNQYYGSYVGSDTSSSNPHLAVFTKNYYEDNDGNVISDLSAYASYFKHMSSYGTALATKPGEVEVEPVEFWEIDYELNDGTTKDSFIYEYSTPLSEEIILPVLTKQNFQFNGWLLNGELVTSIPAGMKGDLMLIADFTMLEGELYEIKYVNDRENALWPSRPAQTREEIIEELFKDLYEWATANGETKSYNDYVSSIKSKLEAYDDIKLRNPALKNAPAEDGSTEYFLNVPKYYQKWKEFFAIFNEAMIKVNADQVFYTDTYAAMVRMHQFIAWTSKAPGYYNSFMTKFCDATKVPDEIPTSYHGGEVVKLPVLSMENGLKFLGWYNNAEFTGEPIESILSTDSGNKTFYAKWDEETLVEKFEVNSIEELLLFTTHQLVWTINPENATNKEIEFFSSNESVAKITQKGLITALKKGTTTITIKVYGNRELDVTFDVNVYIPDHIEASYESDSFVGIGETVELNAVVSTKEGLERPVEWSSLTPEIATVDENGVVEGIKAGLAKIVAKDPQNADLQVEFVITVLDEESTEILDFVLGNHESNVFTEYNLGIGSGTPDYYADIFGSVNKLLMNEFLKIDNTYLNLEVENKTGDYFDSMTSIEFITVHYTGNMSSTANAKANADYFVDDNAVSIHYATGNDGVYAALPHDKGAWHSGDSGAYDVVGAFKWIPTGVAYKEGDPQYPDFSVSTDFYYEINGQKTKVPMARPWNYSSRGTDHILNSDGTISSNSNFGGTGFTNRLPESFINDMELPFKIVDGEYYMGTTWWCYTQVYEGRICSTGGNRNSLGIESCVNKGSDLWYTWQKTAQLVAKLMLDNNLDITRVRGHHFFSGKDCPQPMLENNLEIWYEFLELVEAEYELLTKYNGYTISFESHNPNIIDEHGRVIKQPNETTCVTYTVTITKDGKSQSVTLSSLVPGLYDGR